MSSWAKQLETMKHDGTTFMVVFRDPDGKEKPKWATDYDGALKIAVDIATGQMGSGNLTLVRVLSVEVSGSVGLWSLAFTEGRIRLERIPTTAVSDTPDLTNVPTGELWGELLSRDAVDSLVLKPGQHMQIAVSGLCPREYTGPRFVMVSRQ